MSLDNAEAIVSSHSLRSSSRLDAGNTSRYTVFTTSPSRQLCSRTPSPAVVGRSTSLRSDGYSSQSRGDIAATSRSLSSDPEGRTTILYSSARSSSTRYSSALLQPTAQNTTIPPKQQSLYPRPSSTPHIRRRSWFREDDPSAFGPTSSDPAALSPMATFRLSMSEDELRDELFSSSSSPVPLPTRSLQQECQTPTHDPDRNPAIRLSETSLLAPPSRARSASTRSYSSNPEVIIDFANDDLDLSLNIEGDLETQLGSNSNTRFESTISPSSSSHHPAPAAKPSASTPGTHADTNTDTTRSTLVSGPRIQKRSAWDLADRAQRRSEAEARRSTEAKGSL